MLPSASCLLYLVMDEDRGLIRLRWGVRDGGGGETGGWPNYFN